jgi:hypothetical protein
MLSRRSALKGGTATVAAMTVTGAVAARVAVDDPVVALRDERQRVLREVHAQPETIEGEAVCMDLIGVVCRLEVQILETEPQTLAGALAQVEQLCHWEEEGVVIGGEEAIARLIEVLPGRIERLAGRAES